MDRSLFLDMNSFYASVEQQRVPALRRRPLVVVPLRGTDATVAIAASYEAKALGIRTGTPLHAARKLCPSLRVVIARPGLYLQMHAAIVQTLRGMFGGVKVLSVDEMACVVGSEFAVREDEARLGLAVKRRLTERLGPCLRCSVGIAPNVFLAKVAAEMQKPDGLTILDEDNMPQALFMLHLPDLPGINARMCARLERHGITTVRALWEADARRLRRAWGSLVGERWWHMLRGSAIADYGAMQSEVKKSVGHSHVLPPELRSERGAREVLLRLFSRALKRLRSYGQAAGCLEARIEFRHPRRHRSYHWTRRSAKHLPACDDTTWLRTLRPMLEAMPPPKQGYEPFWAGLTFGDLVACRDMNLSLFEDAFERPRLAMLVDALNDHVADVTDLASTVGLKRLAPHRIAYGAPDEGRSDVG